MISGDQVLPKISSNVSVFPTEPDGDPLTDWLTSLARIKTKIPDDVLVLPAHNDPFHGLHARIDHLISGHERGLVRLHELLAEPKRVVDVFSVLFRRKINEYLLGLATGESLAHLNCLIARGQAVREQDRERRRLVPGGGLRLHRLGGNFREKAAYCGRKRNDGSHFERDVGRRADADPEPPGEEERPNRRHVSRRWATPSIGRERRCGGALRP